MKVKAISNRILYLVSLNHATNDSSVSLLSTLFPVVLTIFRISLFELGILVAAMYATNVVCQPITGHYSERYESRFLLPLGIGIVGISMILIGLSSDFPTLLFSSVVMRIGSSFFHPVGVSTISRCYTGESLDRSMGFQSAFGNFGIFIVFLASAPIYLKFGWSAPFIAFALLDAIVVLITIAKLGKVRADSFQKTIQPRKFIVSLPIFFLVSTFISGGANAMVVNYGNVLLEKSNFSVFEADIMIAAWIGFSFLGAFFTGALTRRFTRRRLLASSYLVSCVTILTFALFPSNATVSIPSLALNGFALAVTYPAIYSELSSFLGSNSERKGAAYGMLFSNQIIGSAVLGFFAGYISADLGLSFPFEVTSALLFAGALASLGWKNRAMPSDKNPKIF